MLCSYYTYRLENVKPYTEKQKRFSKINRVPKNDWHESCWDRQNVRRAALLPKCQVLGIVAANDARSCAETPPSGGGGVGHVWSQHIGISRYVD